MPILVNVARDNLISVITEKPTNKFRNSLTFTIVLFLFFIVLMTRNNIQLVLNISGGIVSPILNLIIPCIFIIKGR